MGPRGSKKLIAVLIAAASASASMAATIKECHFRSYTKDGGVNTTLTATLDENGKLISDITLTSDSTIYSIPLARVNSFGRSNGRIRMTVLRKDNGKPILKIDAPELPEHGAPGAGTVFVQTKRFIANRSVASLHCTP